MRVKGVVVVVRERESCVKRTVKCFTLNLSVKYFTLRRDYFTVDQILHQNKYGKMCKIFYLKTFTK